MRINIGGRRAWRGGSKDIGFQEKGEGYSRVSLPQRDSEWIEGYQMLANPWITVGNPVYRVGYLPSLEAFSLVTRESTGKTRLDLTRDET